MHSYDGSTLGPDAPADTLLLTLGGYLAGAYRLSENDLLSLKSWLVLHAERFRPGQFMSIEEPSGSEVTPSPDTMWALVGKAPSGETIVWHRPLPWPTAVAKFFS